MHQAGGSADRKKDASRCAAVRQRGAAILAADINLWRSAKTSHSRAVPSLEAVTTRLSSGLNAALNTLSGWCMTAIELRESISHSRAVLSQDAVTMRLPSGLNAALVTRSVWPLSSPIGRPVSASQSSAVGSSDAVTTRLSS